jgi:glycosyltransferase involved in cell wall biosynthesis
MAIQVSVVVSTSGHLARLSRCLSSLVTQDYGPDIFEIVVSDRSGSQKVREFIGEFNSSKLAYFDPSSTETRTGLGTGVEAHVKNTPTINYIDAADCNGTAAIKNKGWQASQGEIIGFIKDDIIASPGWLSNVMRLFKDNVMGVTGQVIQTKTDPTSGDEIPEGGLETIENTASNCFYQRSLLYDLNGFDERFTIAYQEESDFYLSTIERGYRIASSPGATIQTPARRSDLRTRLQHQQKRMFNALLYKKHPNLLKNNAGLLLPIHYYISVTSLFVALWAFLTVRFDLAMISLSIWLLIGTYHNQRVQENRFSNQDMLSMVVTSSLTPLLAVYWSLVGVIKYRVFSE